MKQLLSVLLAVLLSVAFFCCGNEKSDNDGNYDNNPIPTLTQIAPAQANSGSPAFTMTLTGTGFISSSKVIFNEAEKTTTYVSAAQLTAQIDSADITSVTLKLAAPHNIEDKTVPVLVRNPSPGGGDSNTVNFKIITEDSISFTTPVVINSTKPNSTIPRIARDSKGTLYVVWRSTDEAKNSMDYFFSKSENAGTSWASLQRIANEKYDYGGMGASDLIVDGSDYLHFIWAEGYGWKWYPLDYVLYRRLPAGGSWTAEKELTDGEPCNENHVRPIIAAYNNVLMAIWEHKFNYDNDFSLSLNGGASWTTATSLKHSFPYYWDEYCPQAVYDKNGKLHLVFTGGKIQNYLDAFGVFYCNSSDNGSTWTNPIQISASLNGNIEYYGLRPYIACDPTGQKIVVSYTLSMYMLKYTYKYRSVQSVNGGATWTERQTLHELKYTSNFRDWIQQSLVIDNSGNFHIFFYDEVDNADSTTNELYHIRSKDNGRTWSKKQKISTQDAKNPFAIAGSNGKLYVTWERRVKKGDNYESYPVFCKSK